MEYKDRIKAARKHAKLTQAALAEAVGMKQASISELETGKSQSSTFNASIAKECGVNAVWLETGQGKMTDPDSQPGPPSEDDYALIPQYTVKGDCGDGYLNEHVEVNGGLAFKRDWIKRMGARPESLYVIYAEGDSMEPYIFEGDVVLFDTSSKEPRDRQVYAIRRPNNGISIKRLVQQLSGAWLVRSDNQDKMSYPDEPVSEKVLHEIPILGRVIWRGGGIG